MKRAFQDKGEGNRKRLEREGGKRQRDMSIKAGKDAFKKESLEAQPREQGES